MAMNFRAVDTKVFLGLLLSSLILSWPLQLASASALQATTQVTKAPDAVHQLWTENIKPIFPRPVTTSAGAYYAGHMLMVPLHAAFSRNDPEWEKDFSDYFRHLSPDQLTDVLLSRLQFLYLASEFIVLAEKSGHSDLIPPGLPDLLFSEVRAAWLEKPAIQWEHPAFKGGLRERILWRLNTHTVAKSYFRAIMDDDLFLFAIAAELRTYGGTPAQERVWREPLDDVLTIAHRVYTQEVTPTPFGGWNLQPGVWADHPDFQYAGSPRAEPGIRR